MKNLYTLLLIPFSLLCLNIKPRATYSYHNVTTIIDTLPADTLRPKNPIDTFGGIKGINDTILKGKKDSTLK
jgi:hypothetical protein